MSNESKGYYAYGVLFKSDRYQEWEHSKGEAYAFYRNEWGEDLQKLILVLLPLNFNAEVTTRCNLAVASVLIKHCDLIRSQIYPLPLYKRVLTDARTLTVKVSTLST